MSYINQNLVCKSFYGNTNISGYTEHICYVTLEGEIPVLTYIGKLLPT